MCGRSLVVGPGLFWDLDLVLKNLMSERYELREAQDLRTLTKKTLSLVAFATTERVGVLQVLSNVVSFIGQDRCVS